MLLNRAMIPKKVSKPKEDEKKPDGKSENESGGTEPKTNTDFRGAGSLTTRGAMMSIMKTGLATILCAAALAMALPGTAIAGSHVEGTHWANNGYGSEVFCVDLHNDNWGRYDNSSIDVYITYNWVTRDRALHGDGSNVHLGEFTLGGGDAWPIGAFRVPEEAMWRDMSGSWKVTWYSNGRYAGSIRGSF